MTKSAIKVKIIIKPWQRYAMYAAYLIGRPFGKHAVFMEYVGRRILKPSVVAT